MLHATLAVKPASCCKRQLSQCIIYKDFNTKLSHKYICIPVQCAHCLNSYKLPLSNNYMLMVQP